MRVQIFQNKDFKVEDYFNFEYIENRYQRQVEHYEQLKHVSEAAGIKTKPPTIRESFKYAQWGISYYKAYPTLEDRVKEQLLFWTKHAVEDQKAAKADSSLEYYPEFNFPKELKEMHDYSNYREIIYRSLYLYDKHGEVFPLQFAGNDRFLDILLIADTDCIVTNHLKGNWERLN